MTDQSAAGVSTVDSDVTADAPGGALFPFPVQPVTARQQLRDAVVLALRNAKLTVGAKSVTVDSPGDWPYQQADLPAICVRSQYDNKQGLSRGQVNFTTTVEVDVRGAVYATTAEAAQAALDSLWFQVERAILLDFYVTQLIQKAVSVETSAEPKADGQPHIFGAVSRFRFETFETFDISQPIGEFLAPSPPNPIVPLTEVTVDVTKEGSDPPFSPQPGDVGLTITLPED